MEKFNQTYIKFVKDLYNSFDIVKEKYNDEYFKQDQFTNLESEVFIKDFVKYNLPYMVNIALRNPIFFITSELNIMLIRKIKFKNILEKSNDDTLEKIFKYLHALYVLSLKLDLKKYVDDFEDSVNYDLMIKSINNKEQICNFIKNKDLSQNMQNSKNDETQQQIGNALSNIGNTLTRLGKDAEKGEMTSEKMMKEVVKLGNDTLGENFGKMMGGLLNNKGGGPDLSKMMGLAGQLMGGDGGDFGSLMSGLMGGGGNNKKSKKSKRRQRRKIKKFMEKKYKKKVLDKKKEKKVDEILDQMENENDLD